MEKENTQPEGFRDQIIFMSMYNDIDWGRKGNETHVYRIPQVLPQMPEGFPKDIGHSSDLELKKNGISHTRLFVEQSRWTNEA